MKVNLRKTKEEGITLIALIVTIIVLLILAGVIIVTTLSQNGIITKAEDARTAREISTVLEDLKLKTQDARIRNKGEASLKTFVQILSEDDENTYIVSSTQRLASLQSGSMGVNEITDETEEIYVIRLDYDYIEVKIDKNLQVTLVSSDSSNSGTTEPEEDVPTSYTITYNSNGGSGEMAQTTGLSVSASTNTFVAPTNKGFKEWNTSPTGDGTKYAEGDTVDSTVTLYAIWGYGDCVENGTRVFFGVKNNTVTRYTFDKIKVTSQNKYKCFTNAQQKQNYEQANNSYWKYDEFDVDGNYTNSSEYQENHGEWEQLFG